MLVVLSICSTRPYNNQPPPGTKEYYTTTHKHLDALIHKYYKCLTSIFEYNKSYLFINTSFINNCKPALDM